MQGNTQRIEILTGVGVFLSGALGGIVGYFTGLAAAFEGSRLEEYEFLNFLIVGGLSSGIFVYLIAGSDTRNFVRLFFLCVFVGVFSQPVLLSAKKLVLDGVIESGVGRVADGAAAVRLDLSAAAASGQDTTLSERNAINLIERANNLSFAPLEFDQRTELRSSVENLLSTCSQEGADYLFCTPGYLQETLNPELFNGLNLEEITPATQE